MIDTWLLAGTVFVFGLAAYIFGNLTGRSSAKHELADRFNELLEAQRAAVNAQEAQTATVAGNVISTNTLDMFNSLTGQLTSNYGPYAAAPAASIRGCLLFTIWSLTERKFPTYAGVAEQTRWFDEARCAYMYSATLHQTVDRATGMLMGIVDKYYIRRLDDV